MKAVHVTIAGRVQGVGYRAWTVDMACQMGLTGWVRNRIDKSVEAFFQGDEKKIDRMLLKCEEGPLLARVHNVKSRDAALDPELVAFSSKSTL